MLPASVSLKLLFDDIVSSLKVRCTQSVKAENCALVEKPFLASL